MLAWFRGLLRRAPQAAYSAEGLGVMRFDRGIWCTILEDGRESLLLSCSGDEKEPAPGELTRLRDVWRDRQRYFSAAMRYLEKHEPDPEQGAAHSTPYGISVEDWEDADCVIELLGPDEETVWRIAFRGETPVQHAFDH